MSTTAAAPDIIDLDALVRADRKAKLGGVTYRFPGDMPMEIYLRTLAAEKRLEEIGEDGDVEVLVEITEELADTVLELFQIRQPEMESLPMEMNMPLLHGLLSAVYGAQEDPTPPAPRNRAERRAGGTKSSSRKPAAKSGSSTRS